MKRFLVALFVLLVATVGRLEASEGYTIKPGQTLSGLTLRFMGSAKAEMVQEVADYNGIANPDLIYAGAKLYFPTKQIASVKVPRLTAKSAITVGLVIATSVVETYLCDSPQYQAALSLNSKPALSARSVAHFAPLPSSSSSVRLSSFSCYSSVVEDIADQVGIEASLIRAVMHAESGCNPNAWSPKGAMGLMQLMPDSARLYHVDDPWDPEENIRGGALLLKDLIGRFEGNKELALAAYNAGIVAVKKHGGVPPFKETRNYLATIRGWLHRLNINQRE